MKKGISRSEAYAAAGVDITAGYKAVERKAFAAVSADSADCSNSTSKAYPSRYS